MKRIICLLLAAAMLISICTAWAEKNGEALIVYEAGESLAKEWSEMLGLKQPPIELDCTESVMELVKGNSAPDIIVSDDFFTLKEAGMVAAFEPTELMKEEMAAMPQYLQDVIRENLMAEDGKLLGYLNNLDVQPLGFYVPDAWEASPYRDMTPPSSVEEILDFLEIYLETPHDGFCFIHDATDGWWGRLWVVTLLMRCWAIQSNYAKIPLRYNNPEFIRLLERTVDLFNRLLKVEKGKKNQKGRQLFQDNLFSRGPTGNNLDTITYASLIPWRLTKDQPPLIHVMADFYCVRTGSPYEDRAAELLERIIPGREAYCSREIRPLIYEFINPDRVDVEGFNKMILKKLGGKYSWKLVTQEYIDSLWDIHKYTIPTIVSDDYQNLNSHIDEDPEVLFGKLVNGEVTAADFAAKWDEMNGWTEPAQ